MTGLDLSRDALIEVACVVTDAELTILSEGVDVVIKPEPEAVAGMNDFVRSMHTSSGLITELDAGLGMAEAEDIILAHIQKHCPDPKKALLAGNSIGTDKTFLTRDMPRVIDHLHYRVLDVSTLKELARRWYPRAYFKAPAKTGNHRALGDILDSINELRYYREAIMVPAPGPDSATAQSIAESVLASSDEGR